MTIRAALLAMLIAAALAGCVSFRATEVHSGAATVEDFNAEQTYIAVYAQHIAKFTADSQVFLPSGSNPGPCNKGGSKQGCYDADTVVIADLQAVLAALAATPVPPRFVDADKLLRSGLAEQIQALQMRNQAIAQSDDTLFVQHKAVMDRAIADIRSAYEAFPEDHRPQPGP